jgi:dienelactone hydrolase
VILAVLACMLVLSVVNVHGEQAGVTIQLRDGGQLPAYFFLPNDSSKKPLPAVVVAAGAGGPKLIQYRSYCRKLADKAYAVLLIDGSNFPQSLTPGPGSWRKMPYHLWSWITHLIVAARLAFDHQWYVENLHAGVDYVCASPRVRKGYVALSGFSQSANAVLAEASLDPRVRCVVWNNGGWPWIMPYDPTHLPAVLIFHGEDDGVYNVRYARQLDSELKKAGVPHECYIYPAQRHMFNVYYDLDVPPESREPAIKSSFARLVAFLNRVLTGTPKAVTGGMTLDRREPADEVPPGEITLRGDFVEQGPGREGDLNTVARTSAGGSK